MRHGLAGKESHVSILPDVVSDPSRPEPAGHGNGRIYGEWKAANMIAVSLSTISSLGSLTSTLSR